MEAYELPTEFDLIVVGTGMIESIVAAAASRIGKRVLHIDSCNYYGGSWASFSLDAINKPNFGVETKPEESNKLISEFVKEGEQLLSVGNDLFDVQFTSREWNVPEKLDEVTEVSAENKLDDPEGKEVKERVGKIDDNTWTIEKLLKNARKFNIDLVPKLHFARGDFVELMISSNIARYSEFRSVSRVLTCLNGQLEVVPCSRSDVFSSKRVSIVEKRMLMKLLTSCLESDDSEFSAYEHKPFKQYLKDKKLTENLIHFVVYAIAMGNDDLNCLEGVKNTQRFLNSLGRFGKTPFLYSMYGSGELTQAFCRLSAVFGGTYALNQSLNGYIFDKENNFKSVIVGSQNISAPHLVVSVDKVPADFVKDVSKKGISRAVFITDRSIMASEKEHLTLLLVPPLNGKHPCTILELGTLTGTCPKDLYLVHMSTRQLTTPKEDLKHCADILFATAQASGSSSEENSVPQVLWSSYFSIPDTSQSDLNVACENVAVCSGPDMDLDYDPAIKQAKGIFHKLYPDLEFLPRAPDPEEIVFETMDNNNTINDLVGEEEVVQPIPRSEMVSNILARDYPEEEVSHF